jgi:hypothetical protein
MISTSIFVPHSVKIPFSHMGRPIYLVPFGDVHRDTRLCHVRKWKEFLQWAADKEDFYAIGMGDYLDMASTSERCEIRKANLHETTIQSLEDIYREKALEFVEEIKFMKGKIIGMIEGNHYAEFQNGTTSTQFMCEKLGCKYLGAASAIRLFFHSVGHKRTAHIDIMAAHGSKTASQIGGSINQVVKLSEVCISDIFLLAHDHKKAVGMQSVICLTGNKAESIRVKSIKQLYCRTGSFLQSYVPNEPSYAVGNLFRPSDIGVVKIELTPKENEQEGFHIDIHASI